MNNEAKQTYMMIHSYPSFLYTTIISINVVNNVDGRCWFCLHTNIIQFFVVVFGTCHCRCAIVRQTQIDMINKNKQWFGGTTNAVCVSTQKDVRKDSNQVCMMYVLEYHNATWERIVKIRKEFVWFKIKRVNMCSVMMIYRY